MVYTVVTRVVSSGKRLGKDDFIRNYFTRELDQYSQSHAVLNTLECSYLGLLLLLTPDFEVLAALQGLLVRLVALLALHLQHNLLGRLHVLLEDGLRLPTETGLLPVVTSLTCGWADRHRQKQNTMSDKTYTRRRRHLYTTMQQATTNTTGTHTRVKNEYTHCTPQETSDCISDSIHHIRTPHVPFCPPKHNKKGHHISLILSVYRTVGLGSPDSPYRSQIPSAGINPHTNTCA